MRCNKAEPPAPRTKPTGALKLRARGVRRDHGVTCFSLLLGPHGHVMFVRPEGLTCSRAPRGANVVRQREPWGRLNGHKQVAHNRSGSCPCPGPRLVFAAALDSYCAHGKPAARHNAGAAATVAKPYAQRVKLVAIPSPHQNAPDQLAGATLVGVTSNSRRSSANLRGD